MCFFERNGRHARHKRMFGVLLSVSLLSAVLGLFPSAAFAIDSGNILSHATVPSSSEVASSKYAVIAQFKDGLTQTIVSGATLQKANDGKDRIVDPPDSQKGKIKVTYTNIGSYKGRTLNFQFVVTDWQKAGFPGGEWMRFYDTGIGFSQGGYNYVSLKGTYLYADSGQPATDLTGSYMTVNDFDSNQFMSFDSSMMNKIDKMYAYSGSYVDYWTSGGKTNIGSRFWQAIDSDDKRGYVTFLVSGYQFDFDWHKDWSQPTSNNNPYNMNHVVDWYTVGSKYNYTQYFGYIPEKPVRTEVLEPTKKIINSAGQQVDSNTITAPDSFAYEIYHTVPAEFPEFYYNSYVMQDKISDVLSIDSVKIYNGSNQDVTGNFNISTGGNLIKASPKSGVLSNSSFYGQDYRMRVNVSAKTGAALYNYANGRGQFNVTNQASAMIDGGSKNTNTVTTTIKMPQTEVDMKKIQIYTDKSTDGLPVVVNLATKNVYSMYNNQTFDVALYRGSDLMARKTVKISDADNPVNLTIPSSKLAVNHKDNYKAVIENYDSDFINVPSDKKQVDTDGYTANEGTLTQSSGQPATYKGVVKSERELGSAIKLYYENLSVDYKPSQTVKAGYGYELYGKADYSNELMAETGSKIGGFNRTTDVIAHVDKALVDKTLSYYDASKSQMNVPLLRKSEDYATNVSAVTYQAPHIYLEKYSGDTFTEAQKNAGAMNEPAADAGNKLYIPTWIKTLGTYHLTLNSNTPLGVNQVKFSVNGTVTVPAYMFSHEGSNTVKLDELLIHPMAQSSSLFGW